MDDIAPQKSFNDTTALATEISNPPHTPNEVVCRCGCVPKDMMSLFQMAEKRATYREKKRLEAAAEAEAEKLLNTSTTPSQ
jgi:hypothetical protein